MARLRVAQRFRLAQSSALIHPAFLLSLGLLLLNDHIFKGSGGLPGALTGKLSDFAGMIVAPTLALAVVGTSGSRRIWAYGVAVLPFLAINLSSGAAASFEQLGALFGLSYHVTVDPTDLFALVVLPLNEWIHADARHFTARPILQRAILAIAAFACVATSVPPSGIFTHAYILNQSSETISVRVRRPAGAIPDCNAIADVFAEAYDPALFVEGTTATLAPGEAFGLDRSDGLWTHPITGELIERACGMALIDIEGIGGKLVFWTRDAIPEHVDTGNALLPEHVQVAYVGGSLRVGEDLAIADPIEVPQTNCQTDENTDNIAINVGEALEASGLELLGTDETTATTIVAIEPLDDGCLRIVHRIEEATEPEPSIGAADEAGFSGLDLYLCIPQDAMLFEVGDRFYRPANSGFGTEPEPIVLVSERGKMTIRTGPTPRSAAFDLRIGEARCDGYRLACGAFVQPTSIFIDDITYRVGDRITERRAAATHELHIARAERVVLGVESCPGREAPGFRFDTLAIEEMNP